MPGVKGWNSKDEKGGLAKVFASSTLPGMKAKIPNTQWFIQVKNETLKRFTVWPETATWMKLHGQTLMLVWDKWEKPHCLLYYANSLNFQGRFLQSEKNGMYIILLKTNHHVQYRQLTKRSMIVKKKIAVKSCLSPDRPGGFRTSVNVGQTRLTDSQVVFLSTEGNVQGITATCVVFFGLEPETSGWWQPASFKNTHTHSPKAQISFEV